MFFTYSQKPLRTDSLSLQCHLPAGTLRHVWNGVATLAKFPSAPTKTEVVAGRCGRIGRELPMGWAGSVLVLRVL